MYERKEKMTIEEMGCGSEKKEWGLGNGRKTEERK